MYFTSVGLGISTHATARTQPAVPHGRVPGVICRRGEFSGALERVSAAKSLSGDNVSAGTAPWVPRGAGPALGACRACPAVRDPGRGSQQPPRHSCSLTQLFHL